ncbi:hypothetical protein B0H11DRAFT_1910412 [Mycena galericulata]|nr:hypothetical protein B0H11DRAFT_1910412 [Mycena galericulata]
MAGKWCLWRLQTQFYAPVHIKMADFFSLGHRAWNWLSVMVVPPQNFSPLKIQIIILRLEDDTCVGVDSASEGDGGNIRSDDAAVVLFPMIHSSEHEKYSLSLSYGPPSRLRGAQTSDDGRLKNRFEGDLVLNLNPGWTNGIGISHHAMQIQLKGATRKTTKFTSKEAGCGHGTRHHGNVLENPSNSLQACFTNQSQRQARNREKQRELESESLTRGKAKKLRNEVKAEKERAKTQQMEIANLQKRIDALTWGACGRFFKDKPTL